MKSTYTRRYYRGNASSTRESNMFKKDHVQEQTFFGAPVQESAGNESQAIAEWKTLKDTEMIPSGAPPITFYDHARDFSMFEYETDHKEPLGKFWNAGENSKGDSAKKETLLRRTNLQVLTEEANKKKGGVKFLVGL